MFVSVTRATRRVRSLLVRGFRQNTNPLAGSLAVGALVGTIRYCSQCSSEDDVTFTVDPVGTQVEANLQHTLLGDVAQPLPIGDEYEYQNWSGTHTISSSTFIMPENEGQAIRALRIHAQAGRRLRAVGSQISPNASGLSPEGMISTALLDKIIYVDPSTGYVTMQAGARVKQATATLHEHGLVLQNYASIDDQQMGGFTQVSAHGTGATIPPVDETVVGLTVLVPPSPRHPDGIVRLGSHAGAADARQLADHSPAPSTASQDTLDFLMTRVGLGALGLVSSMTVRAVPAHRLRERTYVISREQAIQGHARRLRNHRHVRYMWVPFADAVVVVACDPATAEDEDRLRAAGEVVRASDEVGVRSEMDCELGNTSEYQQAVQAARQRAEELRSGRPAMAAPESAMRNLARGAGLVQSVGDSMTASQEENAHQVVTEEELSSLGFSGLRDLLLGHAPLDVEWVRQVNRAEADYWRGQTGSERVGWSHELLGFDCGGQQWVSEVCFPAGRIGSRTDAEARESADRPADETAADAPDMAFMARLLEMIEKNGIPAACPIEQRWTARSRSPLSPAHSEDPGAVFSWVGVIMYLPTQEEQQRRQITAAFKAYEGQWRREMWDEFGAAQHWAKIELVPDPGAGGEGGSGAGPGPEAEGGAGASMACRDKKGVSGQWSGLSRRSWVTSATDRQEALQRVQGRFGRQLAAFEALRKERDPRGVLLNAHMEALLGLI